MKRWLAFAVGLALSAGACVWIARRTDLSVAWDQLGALGPTTTVLLALVYALGFIPRTLRSLTMIEGMPQPVRAEVAASAILLGCAANNVLPLRLGEVVRTLYFSARVGCPRATALALVAAERLIDLFFLVIVLLGALGAAAWLHSPLPASLAALLIPAGGIGAILLAVLLSAIFLRHRIQYMNTKVPRRVQALLERLLDAAEFLRNPRRFLRVGAFSVGVWLCEGALYAGAAASLGISNPLLAGYLTLAIVNLSILLPSSPGYVGVFHAAAVFALAPLGVEAERALALALVCHGIPFLLVTSSGFVIFLREQAFILGLRRTSASGRAE